MHIAHVIDGLGFGGAERMLVDIANQTARDGHRVTVCVTRSDTSMASEIDDDVDLVVLERTRRWDLGAILRFARYVRRENVDVVHCHLRSNFAFAAVGRSARLFRAPIVFHDHYGAIEREAAVPLWFRVAHRYADQYVGVHELLCEWAQRAGMPKQRTHLIENALDLGRFRGANPVDIRGELQLPPDVPIGIVVGTVRRDKGIEVVLSAVARSAHRGRFKLVVAGHADDGEYPTMCRQLAQELGLVDDVFFLGARGDVPGLLRAVDFAVIGSHTESGPLVLVEYMTNALPFVATLVGNISRRAATAGMEGFVPPSDVTALADGIDTLLALSGELRAQRGARGEALAEELWDIRRAMPRWYELYESACRR